jgi:hypothetical protein
MLRTRLAHCVVFPLIIVVSACGASAGSEVETVSTLRIPDPQAGGLRKLVIVWGVELSGSLTMRYEHGSAWLNGLEWLPAPPPHGFMVPKATLTLDAGKLSPAAVKMLESVPRVAQLKREGWTTNRAIEIYFAQQESLLEYVSGVYCEALPRGKEVANRMARQAIDPGLASTDTTGTKAPAFSGSGSIRLYFHGLGGKGRTRDGPATEPSPQESAEFLRSRAEGQYQHLGWALGLDAPVLAVYTTDAAFLLIGGDANRGFEEWDRLRAARSAEERREVARSFKVLPANLAAEFGSAQIAVH